MSQSEDILIRISEYISIYLSIYKDRFQKHVRYSVYTLRILSQMINQFEDGDIKINVINLSK